MAGVEAAPSLCRHDLEGTAPPSLLREFRQHRLGTTIAEAEYANTNVDFFNDVVCGATARRGEVDTAIKAKLNEKRSLERLDRSTRAILRAGTFELLARPDVPLAAVIPEYVDLAHAFFDKREAGFVNGLLDAIREQARE